jgi:hypothetical protein
MFLMMKRIMAGSIRWWFPAGHCVRLKRIPAASGGWPERRSVPSGLERLATISVLPGKVNPLCRLSFAVPLCYVFYVPGRRARCFSESSQE